MRKVQLTMPESDQRFDEAMKTLRTNIQFSGADIRTIMMTSTEPNEGKSEITFHTALSFANTGKKVLLIDADIHKSVLTTRYHLDQEVDGLSQYLTGQKRAEEVIYSTNVENFDILFSGPYAPNPAELFESSLMRELLEEAAKHYDYVLVDTPPVGSLIEGAIIAQYCDGAILVIKSGAISYKRVQRVKRQVEKSGCRMLGAVLNMVNTSKGSYYNSYYYGDYDY
ncbi:MAG TPA: CpsD/CapB family tyrosine-protein kinase [Candidatus Lachnoclostridium avicola]|mgnify:FL=1|nr:CpsD/CapB family tyrosine-protein kinase [Candidatus Lachnoclostridium avicola]